MSTDVFDPRNLDAETVAREFVSSTATRALFRRPRRTSEAAELSHLPFLFWLVETMRPASIVSLGLADGLVYFALCQAAERLNRGAQCLGIATSSAEGQDPEIPEAFKNYADEHYGGLSTLRATEANRAARTCADGTVDLLLVGRDTPVSSETLLDDWVPRLSERGTIVLSGIDAEAVSGRQEITTALGDRYPSLYRTEGDGLFLALVGSEQPPHLSGMAAMRPSTAGYCGVDFLFRRAGTLLVAEREAQQLRDKVDTLQGERDAAVKERKELKKRLADVEDAYETRSKAIAGLQAELHDAQTARRAAETRSAELEASDSELAQLRGERKEWQEKLATTIKRAEKSDRSLRARFQELAVLTRSAESTTRDLERARSDLIAEKRAHHDTATVLQAQIEALEHQRMELLASTSWRMMAPARTLSRFVRRL